VKNAERYEGSVLYTQTTHRPCHPLAKKTAKKAVIIKKMRKGNSPIAMLQIEFAGLNHHHGGARHHITE